MIIGVCKIRLRIPQNASLKGKRRVMKSIVTQLRNKFNVTIAEVEDQELWQLATLGICAVGNETRFVNEVLSKAVNFITGARFDVEIFDYQIEIIPC
jgi:uncharacterized protein YlxP (DUF503 family)